MKHWVVKAVNFISSVHVTEHQEVVEPALELGFLVGTCVRSQEMLLVYVEGVSGFSRYVVNGDIECIKVVLDSNNWA
jgi:hypothetical protein